MTFRVDCEEGIVKELGGNEKKAAKSGGLFISVGKVYLGTLIGRVLILESACRSEPREFQAV